MNPGIVIVVSKKEMFVNGARLILEQIQRNGFSCHIIFVEDQIFKHGEGYNNSKKKVFYFLTNVAQVKSYVQNILQEEHVVVNKSCLLREKSKFYLQKTIKQYGVAIPKSVYPARKKNICEISFPCYIKSQQQASTVIRVADKNEFDEAVYLFDSNNEDWYLEEAVEGSDVWLQKAYYIEGKIIARKNVHSFKDALNLISKALNLEVFSVDIFSSKSGGYWVIDVNPAPAFFKSDEARENLAGFLINKARAIKIIPTHGIK
jgi:hypothetical protein